MNVQTSLPLAPLTTIGVGGKARFFIEVRSIQDIEAALDFAHTRSLPIFVLGGGSNIVVADNGFEGVVLSMRIGGIISENTGDTTLVTAGAGVVWDELVAWTTDRGLSGLECLSGIPGTVGGAVVANVGAYGAQCSDTFVHAEMLDTHDLQSTPRVMTKEECLFSYHDSVFGQNTGRYILAKSTFALKAHHVPLPTYRDSRFNLAELAVRVGKEPTVTDIRTVVLDVREQKGLLSMEGRLSYKCAGSFFHMPFVSKEKYLSVLERARALDPMKEERLRPWAWEQADGSYKLAPGFLFEYTEFQKGYVRGDVGISPKHVLSIINIGTARAKDIARLAQDMHNAVETIFGIHLEKEVEYIGSV